MRSKCQNSQPFTARLTAMAIRGIRRRLFIKQSLYIPAGMRESNLPSAFDDPPPAGKTMPSPWLNHHLHFVLRRGTYFVARHLQYELRAACHTAWRLHHLERRRNQGSKKAADGVASLLERTWRVGLSELFLIRTPALNGTNRQRPNYAPILSSQRQCQYGSC